VGTVRALPIGCLSVPAFLQVLLLSTGSNGSHHAVACLTLRRNNGGGVTCTLACDEHTRQEGDRGALVVTIRLSFRHQLLGRYCGHASPSPAFPYTWKILLLPFTMFKAWKMAKKCTHASEDRGQGSLDERLCFQSTRNTVHPSPCMEGRDCSPQRAHES